MTVARAHAAAQARAFPLLRYDPGAAGVFGTRISLDGNPEPHRTWCQDSAGRPLTPADWARGEERFAAFFARLEAADPAPVAVSEYLDLDETARARSTPVVTDERGDGEPVRYRVDPAMVEAVEACRQQWRTLQELSGLVTPFTASIEAEIRERLQAEQRAALADLERESGARLESLRVETESRIAERVTERLLAMAGYPVTRARRDTATSWTGGT